MNLKMYSLAAAGSLAAAVVFCGAAQAKVWDFSYSGGGETGSGTFITGAVGSPYTITGISGRLDHNWTIVIRRHRPAALHCRGVLRGFRRHLFCDGSRN